MISPKDFVDFLNKFGINFFVGVPDSLLKNLISFLNTCNNQNQFHIVANEGNALAVASGYNLATSDIPVVYMQNSGLGNCINPLTSLTNKEVYNIPVLLIIGWRGDPDIKDEPQHLLPGKILKQQLSLLNIPSFEMDRNSNFTQMISEAITTLKKNNSPVAILIKENTFSEFKDKPIVKNSSNVSRKLAIKTILDSVSKNDIILSTTGKASRELYEIRLNKDENVRDFLTVGSMGHVSSIALGLSYGLKSKTNIIILDGDGSCLMHMGSLAILGASNRKNLKYFLINNGVHDSVGGQETVGFKVDFRQIAKGCQFQFVKRCSNTKELIATVQSEDFKKSCSFVEILADVEKPKKLLRPKDSPSHNKENFIKFLRSLEY